jgi:hypothetical protein
MRVPFFIVVSSALVASSCATRVQAPGADPALAPTAPAAASSSANGAILVLVPETGFAPLFPEELEQLRRAVADRVATDVGPGRLLPFEAVDRIERLAREGRAREGGPVCAARPSAWTLRDAAYGRTLQVSADAQCWELPCRLHVRLQRPPADEGAYQLLDEWEIDVATASTTPGSGPWLEAARSLRRPAPKPSNGGGLLGALIADAGKPRPLVEVDHVRAAGAWAEEPTAASFASIQATLDACHEKGWRWASTEHAVLAVGMDGAASRCHVYTLAERHTDGRARCVCDALSRVRFSPATGERRLNVAFLNSASDLPRRDGLVFNARVDGLRVPRGMSSIGTNEHQLAACFADSRLPAPRRARLRLRVDGAGNTVDAVVEEKDPDLKACLEKALRAARSSCTPTGAPLDFAATLTLYSFEDRRGVSLRDLAR